MGMLDEVAAVPALRAGLEAAARNQGGPGADGVSVAAFAAQSHHELDRLRDELLTGAWRPRPALQRRIPKPGGGHRLLAIGCVRDRVVQHAVAQTLARRFDSILHPSAYAWRPGRSAQQCLAAVDAALAEGQHWVFRGDIADFFDTIPHALLLETLRDHTGDEALVALVEHLLLAGTLVGGDIVDPALGTGQGSPLSPFLANLYLLPFDAAVEAAGVRMVRYGDDLCATTWTRAEAEGAQETVARALGRVRLKLNPLKVAVRHLGEGFVFLGFGFHAAGRRPGPKAARALCARLEHLLAARPNDADAEVDEALRGWLTYYGSLAGVPLPEALRDRAETLEAALLQRRQHGPHRDEVGPRILRRRDAEAPPFEPDPQPAPTAPAAAPVPAPQGPWHETIALLTAARGTPDEAEALATLADHVGADAATASQLADALLRWDGQAAAEVLARLGHFADADAVASLRRPEGAPLVPVAAPPRAQGLPVEALEQHDPPRLTPTLADAERLLELWGGAEHTFLRDIVAGDHVERQRVKIAPTAAHALAHLEGQWWMGVFPLRANNSTRWAAFRVVLAAKHRKEMRSQHLPEAVVAEARTLRDTLRALGLKAVLSVEPGRALLVWVLFAAAVTAARARALLALAARRAGQPDPSVTRELYPQQEVTKPDKPGSALLLPLGLDTRTGARAWLLDEHFEPAADAMGALRAIVPVTAEAVSSALGIKPLLPLPAPAAKPGAPAPKPAPKPVAHETKPGTKPDTKPDTKAHDAVALLTSPFQHHPRAQEVYAGCAVFRHMVDQMISGAGLVTSDRMLVADILGRTGDEGPTAAEAVFRHLDDYRPGMGARLVARIYPSPTSCARIRQRLPELTARVGCDCRFRVPPGAYPTPVLHALGAAEVLGLSERVRETASRGGIARAALAAMNEGRKELGTKASALCARLVDLRRQGRVIEKTIAGVESELDALLDEVGEAVLETPSGTLRRVTDDKGVRRFVLEV